MTNNKEMKEKEVFLKDYKVPAFKAPEVFLQFDIFDSKEKKETIVTNTTIFEKNKDSKENKNLILDGNNLQLLEVFFNDKKLSASDFALYEEKESQSLEIKETKGLQKFTLKTIVKIFPEKNKSLAGLYKSDGIFVSQCEPQGFRQITFALDRPDVMSKYKTKITAPKNYHTLLSNGNKLDFGVVDMTVENKKEKRNFALWEDPFLKPSYLFAIVAGDLVKTTDSFKTMSGRNISLEIFTEEKDKHKTAHAMESLKKAMKWDEEKFGREYDLDLFMIVAVDAFNAGAMENKGLNIFNTAAVLCTPESTTDDGFEYIERVVAHEYFHNWTGDRVTCRDWFQLTLKEGLTVFRDNLFSSDMGDEEFVRARTAENLKETQFPEDAGAMAHPIQQRSYIDVENFYTWTVYRKGSEVIRMIMTFLGEKTFRKAMDKYFELYDGKAVTTREFLYAMENVSGKDFSHFENSWYKQAGTPTLEYEEFYDNTSKKYKIKITQNLPGGKKKNPNLKEIKPFHMPIKYSLFDGENKELLQSDIFEIKEKEETFELENIQTANGQKPILSFLQNFSAPVKVLTKNSLEKDLFLMANDNDHYNRYNSSQNIDKKMVDDFYENKNFVVPEEIITAYKSILKNEKINPRQKAQILNLPSLYSIVSEKDIYDFAGALKARNSYARVIANALEKEMKNIYDKLNDGKKYQKTNADYSKRSLKNALLTYLSYADTDYTKVIFEQYQKADNMTDSLASLKLLVDNNTDEKTKALKDFEEKWKDDTLVMNKWFAIQARAKASNVLDEVKNLENSKYFDNKNPNKLRSLFTVFSKNFAFFHQSSGLGYTYIADKVIEIDKFNSKMSSGIAKSFDHYQYLPEDLKKKKHFELARILREKNISKALYEIVSKIIK